MKPLAVAVFAGLFVACAWSATMTGGMKEIALDDEGVLNAANWAVAKHNNYKNDMFRADMVEVVKAQSQVVAGMRYIITVNMTRTDCRKEKPVENCGPTQENYLCTFTIWSRPWMSSIQMQKDTCFDNVATNVPSM